MKKESYEQGSKRLNEELLSVAPNELSDFLEQHSADLIASPHPFADYMRMKFKEKGILQQNVFLAADLAENYGYKLRLCLAAQFSLEEVQEALILYGMAPLHGRLARDAVLTVAIQNGICDLCEVNRLLQSCGEASLIEGYE